MTADRASVRAALAELRRVLGVRPIIAPAAAGPCTICGTAIRRYGADASTLCPLCWDALRAARRRPGATP